MQHYTFESFDQKQPLRGVPVVEAAGHFVFPTKMYLADTLLFILDRKNAESQVSLFNISHTPEYLLSFARQGSGPGEYTGLWEVQKRGNSLWLFDVVNSQVDKYDLARLLTRQSFVPETSLRITRPGILYFIALNDTAFIGGYYGYEPRYTLFNLEGRRFHSFHRYPHLPNKYNVDTVRFQHLVKSNILDAEHSIQPSLGKMVIVYKFTALLEIVNFRSGEHVLTLTGPEDTYPPDYRLIPDGRGVLAKGAPAAYLWVFTTEKYIYLLYSGKVKTADTRSNQVLQLDWQGRPVRRFVLDREVYSFVVVEPKNKLYAICEEDIPLIEYDL